MLHIDINKKDKVVDIQPKFTQSNLDINLVAYLLFCLKTPVLYNIVKEKLRSKMSQDDFQNLMARSEGFDEMRDEFMSEILLEQAKVPVVPKVGIDGH